MNRRRTRRVSAHAENGCARRYDVLGGRSAGADRRPPPRRGGPRSGASATWRDPAGPPSPRTTSPTRMRSIGTGPAGVETSVPGGRHWSLSPTTQTLRCSAASRRTSSFWTRLVSWYSSTRTCLKRLLVVRRARRAALAEQLDGDLRAGRRSPWRRPCAGASGTRGRRRRSCARRSPRPGRRTRRRRRRRSWPREMVACTERGGNRLGSRSRSRTT